MARPELGTKRTCPETGRKFYDLNRDPVVSPYSGVAYPRASFEAVGVKGGRVVPVAEEAEEEELETANVELVSLEEADEEKKVEGGDEDIDIGEGDEDDTFLAEEEEGDDDVSGLIDGEIEDDEEA